MRRTPKLEAPIVLIAALVVSVPVLAGDQAESPERQTMASLRAIAGALLSREEDEVSAGIQHGLSISSWVLAAQPSDLVHMPARRELLSYVEVHELLRPREDFIYLCDIPQRDAWGEKIEAYYEKEKLLSGKAVTVRSSGANRHFDSDVYEVGGFLPGSAMDDIVISGRRFVRWPLGTPQAELELKPTIGRCPGFDDGSKGGEGDELSEEKPPSH